MSCSFKRSSGLIFSAVAAALISVPAFAADSFSAKTIEQYSKGAAAQWLAGSHAKRGADCAVCHTTGKVSDSETEINKQCTTCHGDLKALAEKTKKSTPNPHKSHLGAIQCTACHSGHTASVSYCTNCHDFPGMKIPFGGNAKPANQYEDLSAYDNAAPTHTETTDIVIVGSGAAGFSAAVAAREAGVTRIVMLEKMAVPGGNSQLAAGGMNAAGTPYQKKLGIKDTADMMYADTMKGGKNASNPALARILADSSADSIKWLAEHGAVLEHVGRGGGASAARMHGPAGGTFVGPYLSQFFRNQVKEKAIDLRLNSKLLNNPRLKGYV